jgi:NYN domain
VATDNSHPGIPEVGFLLIFYREMTTLKVNPPMACHGPKGRKGQPERPLLYPIIPPKLFMRTIVYIDGFNLYYRLLKPEPKLRWLDLCALCQRVLRPENQIVKVKYYTARVSGRLDPTAPSRQQAYLDALATLPDLEVHYGNFLVTKPWAGLVHPPTTKPALTCTPTPPYPNVVKVWKTEEKGSDVNLGAHLVRDAFRGAFDVAAVLSNDTDLVEPIRIVAHELNLPVGIIAPVPQPAGSLAAVASFVRHIRPTHLTQSQFPDQLPGTILNRPGTWV